MSILDARQVDLTQYSASVVACALKVCLMDGRQSVLPETMYDRFIDAAGMHCSYCLLCFIALCNVFYVLHKI